MKAAAGALLKSDPSDGGPVVQVRLLPGPYRGFRLNILAPAYTGLMRPQFHAHHYLAIAPPASTSNRRSPTFPCYQSHRIASHPFIPIPILLFSQHLLLSSLYLPQLAGQSCQRATRGKLRGRQRCISAQNHHKFRTPPLPCRWRLTHRSIWPPTDVNLICGALGQQATGGKALPLLSAPKCQHEA